ARVLRRESAARRQGGRIDLQDEVAPALPAAAVDAGQVEAAVLVGFHQQALHRRDAYAGDAALVDALVLDHVLDAVAVGDLADRARHRRRGRAQAARGAAASLDRGVAGSVHAHRHAL